MYHAKQKRLASRIWPKFSFMVETLNRNADMMATIRSYEAKAVQQFRDRAELYSAVNRKLNNPAITYLEFGVWKGASLGEWLKLNTDQASRFYGFDSFEGLPEEWDHAFGKTKKGAFALNGNLPVIADPRVTLIKGWFQNTLRQFLNDHELAHPIVIHNDSDLHSSTQYTLSTLDPYLRAGDVIIFDEYSSPSNEYLAWEQYRRAFMRQAECIGMSDQWTQAAFEIL